ncbi:MAG: four helix bundle protein [Pirellulales bacterium]|nr:four helix bundle protein [Pirellulales bacterium]
MARDYRKIIAWQRGHELTLDIYRVTQDFPAEEKFGLTNQLRRAAYSVPANIAEGAGRGTHKDYLRFLNIALGSLNEVDYFLLLASELHYLDEKNYEIFKNKTTGTFSALYGLIKAVEKEA